MVSGLNVRARVWLLPDSPSQAPEGRNYWKLCLGNTKWGRAEQVMKGGM